MKRSLVQIVAENARAAYAASGFTSYRALGKKAGVSGNTVRNVMEPDARAPNVRGDASPRMDVVEKIAAAMGYEVWQLLQEGFTPKDPPTRVLGQREAQFYAQIEAAYRRLDKSDFDGNSED
jgi:transcriptional regulator with XRE-family HTH domain